MKRLFLWAFERIFKPRLAKLHPYLAHRTFKHVFTRRVVAWKPDIVHAHDGVTLPAAAEAARLTGAKLVFDSHELETHRNPPLPRFRRWQVRHLERLHLPQADRLLTVSNRIADHLAAEYDVARPEVLFNAPPARPGPMPDRWETYDRRDVRSDLKLPKGAFLFCYTGNITMNRGLEVAVIALSRLQGYVSERHAPLGEYYLVAVGNGAQGQKDALKKLAKAHGVENRLLFLSPVAPHRVSRYISTADASIIPVLPMTLSYEFAMPNKLFEAMLAGNPILGSDLVEMEEIITDEGLGLTYVADDPMDCASQMMRLVEDLPVFRRGPSRAAELEARYAWEVQEKRLLDIYAQLFPDELPQGEAATVADLASAMRSPRKRTDQQTKPVISAVPKQNRASR